MKLTDEDIDRISIMRDDGKTTEEIAEAFGVRVTTMRDWIGRLMRDGEIGTIHPCTKWTDKRVEKLIEMKSSGATIEEMIEHFGVSFGAIRGKIDKLVRTGKLPRECGRWKENGLFEYLDAHNLCHRCYRNERIGKSVLCPACIERNDLLPRGNPLTAEQKESNRERRKKRKESGICIDCSKPATHGLYCYEHMIARKKAKLRYLEKKRIERMGIPTAWDIRKANHLCRMCGAPIEDDNPTLYCNACRRRQSEITTALNARMKAEGKVFKFGRALYELPAQRR